MLTPVQIVAEPRRQAILRFVWDEERRASEIAEHIGDITFGAVSQHLRVLREAGFVTQRVEGNSRFYRAEKENLGPLRAYLEAVWMLHLDTLKSAAEEAARKSATKKRRK